MNIKRPNILLISTDQQHADSFSAAGNPCLRTEAIDDLAKRGVSFTKNYSSHPICGPARSSMLTGRMPLETGVYQNGLPIRAGIPNIGQWLRSHSDYETVLSGKWHVREPHTATIDGFNVIASGINCQGLLGDSSVSLACEGYLKNRQNDRPFFMTAMFTEPHGICEWREYHRFQSEILRYPEIANFLPPLPGNFDTSFPEHSSLKQIRPGLEQTSGHWTEIQWRYYLWSHDRLVEFVDAEIGRIIQALRETGEIDDTVIIFTSDHGEGLGRHRMALKYFPYDEAARAPMIISYPHGGVGQGQINHTLASGVDLFATICDFAEILPSNDTMGVSLRPAAEGRSPTRRPYIAIETAHGRNIAIRSERYKFIMEKDDPVQLLFDMDEDPNETINLAQDASHQSIVQQHKDHVRDYFARIAMAPSIPAQFRWE